MSYRLIGQVGQFVILDWIELTHTYRTSGPICGFGLDWIDQIPTHLTVGQKKPDPFISLAQNRPTYGSNRLVHEPIQFFSCFIYKF